MNKYLLKLLVGLFILLYTQYDYRISENNCKMRVKTFETEMKYDSMLVEVNRVEYNKSKKNDSLSYYRNFRNMMYSAYGKADADKQESFNAADNLRIKKWFYFILYGIILVIGLIDFFYEDKK